MIKEKTVKVAEIAAVVLAVGVGAYFAGAKALGACDSKAKAKNTAMASNGATTCEKVHASAMASKNGTDAKATTAAMASKEGSCDAKATTAAMASKGGSCDAKATNAVMTTGGSCGSKAKNAVMTTDADACPYTKSQATRTAAVSAKEGDCSEEACPMEKGAKGAKKDAKKKAEAKGTMASVVPAEAATK
jgi:hypothetical protein